MTFPLAEWIDGHADCRHNLANSGMYRTIAPPAPSPAEIRRADPAELRALLARDLGVSNDRVFLTTGASEANALAILYLTHRRGNSPPGSCRVCFPEYPPLFDTARAAGFRVTDEAGPVELALVSQPRNPEGDLWDRSRFLEWSSGARYVLVDETFREFAGSGSLLGTDRPGLWATGSFTKFFAGDDMRVGFLVPPEDCREEFARFHGLVTNLLPPFSVAAAVCALRGRERIRRRVRAILSANVDAARTAFPALRAPVAPVMFDRPSSGEPGDSLARRALDASVLVCSGSFFGDPSGVRLCLTRRSFPVDLRAYLAVRGRSSGGRGRAPRATGVTGRSARPRPGGSGRATAAPS